MAKVHMNTLIKYYEILLVNRKYKHRIRKILKCMDNEDLELIFLIINDELDRINKRRWNK